jgi:YidC/Oxa1 family membrane protein insertase
MDKNSIFGIIIIAAILIIWGVVQSPNKKELEARKARLDSIARIQQVQTPADTSKTARPLGTGNTVAPAVQDNTQQLQDSLGEFASAVNGKNEFYTIENDLIKLIVSTKGGRPYSVQLKKYKTFLREPVIQHSLDLHFSARTGIFPQTSFIFSREIPWPASYQLRRIRTV